MSVDPRIPAWAGPAPTLVTKVRDLERQVGELQRKSNIIPAGSINYTSMSGSAVSSLVSASASAIPYATGVPTGTPADKTMQVDTTDGDGSTTSGLWQYESGAWTRVGPPTKHASQHKTGGSDVIAPADIGAATSTYADALAGVWRDIPRVSAGPFPFTSADSAAANWILYTVNGRVSQNSGNSAVAHFWLDPADYAVSGKTTKVRIRVFGVANAVAPGMNFTGALSPIATFGGAASAAPTIATFGTNVCSATITTPAAATAVQSTSAGVNFPAAGAYCLTVTISATLAATSEFTIGMALQWQNV